MAGFRIAFDCMVLIINVTGISRLFASQDSVIINNQFLAISPRYCPEMHANEIHELYVLIDITRCPLTLIFTKTHVILSNMKSYENDKKVCFI